MFEIKHPAEEALSAAKMYRGLLETPEGQWRPYSDKTIAYDFILPRFEALARAMLTAEDKIHCAAMVAACNQFIHDIEFGIEHDDERPVRKIETLADMVKLLRQERAMFTERLEKANSLVS